MLIPLALALSLALAPSMAAVQVAATAAETPTGPFTLAPLPYAENALDPVIDAETMKLHWGAHHRAYVNNLNAAVTADPALAGLSLEAMMARMSTLPKAVRDNGGGHWNHSFFWTIMAPSGTGGQPSPRLLSAILDQFGSLPAFRKAFEQAGLRQFGSGWAWLIVKPDGKLAITSTPNQDNPLMDLVPVAERGTPILGNDLWEHAYYLSYRNRRGEYLSKWWDVVNWNEVNRRYEEAHKRR